MIRLNTPAAASSDRLVRGVFAICVARDACEYGEERDKFELCATIHEMYAIRDASARLIAEHEKGSVPE